MGFVMLEGAQGNFPFQAYACSEYYSLTSDFRALAFIKAEPNQNTQTTESERQGDGANRFYHSMVYLIQIGRVYVMEQIDAIITFFANFVRCANLMQ